MRVAVRHSRMEDIVRFINKGANVNGRVDDRVDRVDDDGDTTLLVAARCHTTATITDYLLYRGADINLKDVQGRTPMMLACENEDSRFLILHALMVRSRPLFLELNAQDKKKETALMYAIRHKSPKCARLLIGMGASCGVQHVQMANQIPDNRKVLGVLEEHTGMKIGGCFDIVLSLSSFSLL